MTRSVGDGVQRPTTGTSSGPCLEAASFESLIAEQARSAEAQRHLFYIVFYWPGADGDPISLRCSPYLEKAIRFKRGEVKTLLLHREAAEILTKDSRFECRLRGDGGPANDSQTEYLRRAEERAEKYDLAFAELMEYLGGRGTDRSRALLAYNHRSLLKVRPPSDRLPQLQFLSKAHWEDIRLLTEGVQRTKLHLEAKGWSVNEDTICEPSTGGRPPLFLYGFIRAVHKPISILYNYHGRTRECLHHLQVALRPFVGLVPVESIREALRER